MPAHRPQCSPEQTGCLCRKAFSVAALKAFLFFSQLTDCILFLTRAPFSIKIDHYTPLQPDPYLHRVIRTIVNRTKTIMLSIQ